MNSRVLVIEDNPTNLDLMVYALTAFGYTPVVAKRGEEGIDLARATFPALILCDVQMPGLDGYGVARRLKADPELRGIPLVAVTAYAMVGDREKLLAAGFDDYLAKPIEPSQLAAMLAALMPGQARSPAAAMDEQTRAEPVLAQGTATILVLDDEDINHVINRDLLEPLGYTIVTAQDIPGAMALARERRPDLIISDVGLPSCHGFDFIREVKADAGLRSVPFMFLTATHWDSDCRRQGLELGATRFLYRPMDIRMLLQEIQACLGQASDQGSQQSA